MARAGASASTSERRLGAFAGVYRPTILRMLGMMLFLREGWVVGHAGLLGGLLVLCLGYFITGTTALSISTIATNIRLDHGGAFSLVSKSLGLEAGGAIGVPLYFALAMSGALYIYGFAEVWRFLFPSHPTWAVIAVLYVLVVLVMYARPGLAFHLHLPALVLCVAAIASVWGGLAVRETWHPPQILGSFEGADFWRVFGVFFPATSGVMVGLNNAGRLKDSRRAVPVGVLTAWLTGFVIYATMMFWYASMAPPEVLVSKGDLAISSALVPWAVTLGILGVCLTASFGVVSSSSEMLHALAATRVLPGGAWLTADDGAHPYRRVTLVTGVLLGLTLLLGDLDRVARVGTMFFLVTYGTLNLVLVVEQSLALISFRPTLKVPTLVPVLGAVASIFAMMVLSPAFGLVSIALVLALYFYLASRQLETPWETVRSGMFIALADWAAKKTQRLDERFERAWKPDVLVPVHTMEELDGKYRFLRGMAFPKGSLQLLVVRSPGSNVSEARLGPVVQELQREDLFVTACMIDAPDLYAGARAGAAVMQGGFFRPNVLFLDIEGHTQDDLQRFLDLARKHAMGCAFLARHPASGLGHERRINVWLRDQSPDWEQGLRRANVNLTLLLAYQLSRNWSGELRMLTVVSDEENIASADRALKEIYKNARIPGRDLSWVAAGEFREHVKEAPRADLHLFGLGESVNLAFMNSLVEMTGASCLFVLDSGHESAFA